MHLILSDLRSGSRGPEHAHEVHLRAAIDWLCRAQDVRDGRSDAGGVSAGWSFEDGWLPSYPETSGYIVETFIAASRLLDRPDLVARAHRILDWELSIQVPDGAFPGHFGEPASQPVVFNTGQIMHGLMAGYHELARPECLDSAVRAGWWLLGHQDPDGCWRRHVHNGVPHTYNSRAAWALLRVALAAREPSLEQAARRNIDWALTQQTPCGWFDSNAFTRGQAPFTHTIAYAIRGILESGILLRSEELLAAAEKAALALARKQRQDGWLAGAYGDDWVPKASYCCLTGLAQVAIVWERLVSEKGRGSEYEVPIQRALSYLKRCHHIDGKARPHDGAVAGSAPIWGAYSRFEFPNWAAKFLADALMMSMVERSIPAPPPLAAEMRSVV